MDTSKLIRNLKADWLALAGLVISALAGFLTFFVFTVKEPIPSPGNPSTSLNVEARLHEITQRIDQLHTQFESLSKIPDQSKVSIKLDAIDVALTDLKTRHSKLEEVILSNPTKAIEMPLLRKDLDNVKDAQQQSLSAIRQGIDQVYDLNKWLLGAMAVSIVTLAISNLMKGREKEKPSYV